MTTTARSRLDIALARLDSVIASARQLAREEAAVIARPEHHLGCCLGEYHEGDCAIRRPSRPRYLVAVAR